MKKSNSCSLDMAFVLQWLGMQLGGIEVYAEDEDDARFVWHQAANEVWDRQKKTSHDPAQLVMEVFGCDNDAAWEWLRVNGLVESSEDE